MDVASQLAPANVLARAWGFLEVNGWYVVAAVASYFFLLRPYVLDPAMARVAGSARAPTPAKVRDYEEGMREARRRQMEAAERAAEAHAERERERRGREAEELAALGVRRRGGGRRLGDGERRRGRRRRAATQAEAEKIRRRRPVQEAPRPEPARPGRVALDVPSAQAQGEQRRVRPVSVLLSSIDRFTSIID